MKLALKSLWPPRSQTCFTLHVGVEVNQNWNLSHITHISPQPGLPKEGFLMKPWKISYTSAEIQSTEDFNGEGNPGVQMEMLLEALCPCIHWSSMQKGIFGWVFVWYWEIKPFTTFSCFKSPEHGGHLSAIICACASIQQRTCGAAWMTGLRMSWTAISCLSLASFPRCKLVCFLEVVRSRNPWWEIRVNQY